MARDLFGSREMFLRDRLAGAIVNAMTTGAIQRIYKGLAVTIGAGILSIVGAAIALAATTPAGSIAFVGTDTNIYYCDAKCAEPKCITCKTEGMHVMRERGIVKVAEPDSDEGPGGSRSEIEYGLPTFSPDGKRLAYTAEGRGREGNSFAVMVYDFALHSATRIFESRDERTIYLNWLPDAKHLSFLLGRPSGLSLMLAEVKESAPVRIVTTGMPLYFAWGSSFGELAVHLLALNSDRTEQVALMNLTETSQNVEKVLSSGRTPFKTPCWSPNGKHLAYIAHYHAESNIVVADADAKNPRSIVSLPVGENSFIWAPDSAHIAYSTAITPQNPVYHGIKLVDIGDASSRWLTKVDVAAYFFAPDSRHLVYIGVPSEKPFYSWTVIDIKTGKEKVLGDFLATPEESIAYRYFDQLAISHTIWSPDSTAFIFAGVRLVAQPDKSVGITPAPTAWVVPIDGTAPHRIANAVLAFFSPAVAK